MATIEHKNFKSASLISSILITSLAFQVHAANHDYNRYLMYIFQKYGDGTTIQYKDLVTLMDNLGLRKNEFNADSNNIHNTNKSTISTTTELLAGGSDIESATRRISEGIEDDHMKHNEAQKSLKEKAPSVNVTLKYEEMHDEDTSERKSSSKNDATILDNVCLSAASLKHTISKILQKTLKQNNEDLQETKATQYNDNNVNNIHITPDIFLKLCPILITQMDQENCRTMSTAHFQYITASLSVNDTNNNNKDINWNAWIYAGISIFVLSSCGLLSVILIPVMKFDGYENILNFLIAVAAGTLSGDALIHLLPHSLIDHHHYRDKGQPLETHYDNEHDSDLAVWLCACTFFTAVLMYIIETVIPIIKSKYFNINYHQHHHNNQHGEHQISFDNSLTNCRKPRSNQGVVTTTIFENNCNSSCDGHISNDAGVTKISANGTQSVILSPPIKKETRELSVMLNEAALDLKKPMKPLSPLAFMVIIGDGVHNLTDGLAIGAAFATDPVTGLATSFAVLCHELPHELGDFALLLQNGVSIQRAIYLNLISSILSVIGMIAGLLIAGLHGHMTQWIYAATAGSFLYISFADLLPAMAAKQKNFRNAIIQICGILVGGIIMISIAINEQHLARLFQ